MNNSVSFETTEKPVLVKNLFNKIAPVYDLLNDIISLGMHKKWKSMAVNMLNVEPGNKVLDLCCGSGDISYLILKKCTEKAEIVSVDFSEKMIELAEKRLESFSSVTIVSADAMNLPFEDESFDRVIISFGLRNLENLEKGLKEIRRVLKPSGIYVNIDFGKPSSPVINVLFNIYFSCIVPLLGEFYNKYLEYAYLPESIKLFPSPDTLLKLMEDAGFLNASNKNLFMGFVAIQKALK